MIVVAVISNFCLCRHVQQASLEWLQAKHATNQLLGKVELLFRPFLRWLDRSMERVFTEGARQVRQPASTANDCESVLINSPENKHTK